MRAIFQNKGSENREKKDTTKMSGVWTAVKKSLHCRSEGSEVYEPKSRRSTRNCCKPTTCKSSFKEVIHGNKRPKSVPMNLSPMSVRSSDLINPVIHHVRFTNSGIKVATDHIARYSGAGSPVSIYHRTAESDFDGGVDPVSKASRSQLHRGMSVTEGSVSPFRPVCQICKVSLARQDAEAHYASEHAVTEVLQGDSTRKIIELIFMTGWATSVSRGRIERILKVHNPQTKIAQFEEYREMVKIRAHRLQYSKKHPRCLADGNELLRFYGTTIACNLGQNGSSSLCTLQMCNVCCILRHGFSSQKGLERSVLGVFTNSTSEKAYNSIDIEGEGEGKVFKKALIVCRVIAGRVHKPILETSHELVGGKRSGFDSIAGELGNNNSHIEELYLLNSTALLPCFVIVCKF